MVSGWSGTHESRGYRYFGKSARYLNYALGVFFFFLVDFFLLEDFFELDFLVSFFLLEDVLVEEDFLLLFDALLLSSDLLLDVVFVLLSAFLDATFLDVVLVFALPVGFTAPRLVDISLRLFLSRPSPMPLTFFKSSIDLKGPFFFL